MAKYYATYKCPLCDTLLLYGEPHEVPYDKLPELCAKLIRNQDFFGHPYLQTSSLYIPHKCKDGNCGLAYFAGFKEAK